MYIGSWLISMSRVRETWRRGSSRSPEDPGRIRIVIFAKCSHTRSKSLVSRGRDDAVGIPHGALEDSSGGRRPATV
jgi:hypothetical protein